MPERTVVMQEVVDPTTGERRFVNAAEVDRLVESAARIRIGGQPLDTFKMLARHALDHLVCWRPSWKTDPLSQQDMEYLASMFQSVFADACLMHRRE